MTVRSFVFSLLTSDSILNGLGFDENNTFTSHDEDTPQERPFMILRWGATDVGLNDWDTGVGSNLRRLSVWVHDDPGDYVRIDQAVARVRTLLTSVHGAYTGTIGQYIGQIDWNGDSDDFKDDIVGTITRNSSYTFVGSGS
jgi:hypothetical protein